MTYFYIRTNPSPEVKVHISVSKKVAKLAVDRNKIRRRVRHIVAKFKPKMKPAEYLIVARAGAEKVKGQELEKELRSLVVSRWL